MRETKLVIAAERPVTHPPAGRSPVEFNLDAVHLIAEVIQTLEALESACRNTAALAMWRMGLRGQ